MINPERLYNFFHENGIDFYTGVPDSLLKPFLKYIQDHSDQHIITANEGLAVGLATGYYLSTGKIPLVYFQNSGLGNIVNPITSLADKEMYGVPMLLLIGWRGKPGTKDEPQHLKMGRITTSLLDAMEIPYLELSEEAIIKSIEMAQQVKGPVALLSGEGMFAKYEGKPEEDRYDLVREKVIAQIIASLTGDEIVVCTTGKIGREFYEQNMKAGSKIRKYFLSVGAMGHANHIALGIKLNSDKKVVMLDGDGALLMHMGSLPTIAQHAGKDFIHIVINNGSHESVGGQPTGAFDFDLTKLAAACGYKKVIQITGEKELTRWLNKMDSGFVEIRTNRKSRNDLGRPSGAPDDWTKNFMK